MKKNCLVQQDYNCLPLYLTCWHAHVFANDLDKYIHCIWRLLIIDQQGLLDSANGSRCSSTSARQPAERQLMSLCFSFLSTGSLLLLTSSSSLTLMLAYRAAATAQQPPTWVPSFRSISRPRSSANSSTFTERHEISIQTLPLRGPPGGGTSSQTPFSRQNPFLS